MKIGSSISSLKPLATWCPTSLLLSPLTLLLAHSAAATPAPAVPQTCQLGPGSGHWTCCTFSGTLFFRRPHGSLLHLCWISECHFGVVFPGPPVRIAALSFPGALRSLRDAEGFLTPCIADCSACFLSLCPSPALTQTPSSVFVFASVYLAPGRVLHT